LRKEHGGRCKKADNREKSFRFHEIGFIGIADNLL
jgi:hypothetical protein